MKWRKAIMVVIIMAIIGGSIGYFKKDPDDEKDDKVFTAFIAEPGEGLAYQNDVREQLVGKTGCKVRAEWIQEGEGSNSVDKMIASRKYPDLIDGYERTSELISAGALIPLENYIDEYPNLKNYLTEIEWEKLKDEEGHIYIIPQYNVVNKKDASTMYRKGAFWIQKCVLEWAGYPEIKYLQDYFDLIYNYKEEHPTFQGQSTIGLTIYGDSTRNFNFTDPILLISGYPEEGCAIVDKDTLEARNFDLIPQAKAYYKLLNEQYWRGVIPSNMFVTSYSDYLNLVASGRVLGVIDQYWQFEKAQLELYQKGLPQQTYVPLYLALDDSVRTLYRTEKLVDSSHGIGITVNCQDVRKVLQFMNDLLEPDNMVLRYWGQEGVDYMVSETGVFYRTEEQRRNSFNIEYLNKHFCSYNYLPHYEGYLSDGINTVLPSEQPDEYRASLCEYDRNFLDAYGYGTFMDFLKDVKVDTHPWSKLSTYIRNLHHSDSIGKIRDRISQEHMYWIPQLILCPKEEFDTMWEQYQEHYNQVVDVKAYEEAMTKEVHRRVEKSRERE